MRVGGSTLLLAPFLMGGIYRRQSKALHRHASEPVHLAEGHWRSIAVHHNQQALRPGCRTLDEPGAGEALHYLENNKHHNLNVVKHDDEHGDLDKFSVTHNSNKHHDQHVKFFSHDLHHGHNHVHIHHLDDPSTTSTDMTTTSTMTTTATTPMTATTSSTTTSTTTATTTTAPTTTSTTSTTTCGGGHPN